MTRAPLRCDILIIGNGSEALAAYQEATARGRDCVLIDPDPAGLPPRHSAEMQATLLMRSGLTSRASRLGLGLRPGGAADVRNEISAALNNMRASRGRAEASDLSLLYKIPENRHLHGTVSFVSPVQAMCGDLPVNFTCAVICTGTMPRLTYEQSRIPGIVTIDDFYETSRSPAAAAVFGSATPALETGQALSYLGADVTVFTRSDLWHLTDPLVQKAARRALGLRFNLCLGSFITSIEDVPDGYRIFYFDDDSYENYQFVDTVIAVPSRMPNVGNMHLMEAGIKLDRTGHILVNGKTMQSTAPHIFAAGGVVSGRRSAGRSQLEGRQAGRNAATYPEISAMPGEPLVDIAMTDPAMAMVGSSLAELKEQERAQDLRLVTAHVQPEAFDLLEPDRDGMLGLYADADTHLIRGAEMCLTGAEHLAQTLALGMLRNCRLEDLADFSFPRMSPERYLGRACARALESLADHSGRIRTASGE